MSEGEGRRKGEREREGSEGGKDVVGVKDRKIEIEREREIVSVVMKRQGERERGRRG